MQALSSFALLLLLPSALSAQTNRLSPTGSKPLNAAPGPELWVSGFDSGEVHRYQATQGNVTGPGLVAPAAQSITQGPDGIYYVAAEGADAVMRFDGTRALGPFVFDNPATPGDETGGLLAPTSAVFGPDGNFYVAGFNSNQVIRYDGSSGANLGVFIPQLSGGLLYVTSDQTKPIDVSQALQTGYEELLHTIREGDPSKPSTRFGSLGNTATEIAAKRLQGDLDWIVMKALEKDRTRRYGTANGFADDIERYLNGEEVEAAPPSARYRLGKGALERRKGFWRRVPSGCSSMKMRWLS